MRFLAFLTIFFLFFNIFTFAQEENSGDKKTDDVAVEKDADSEDDALFDDEDEEEYDEEEDAPEEDGESELESEEGDISEFETEFQKEVGGSLKDEEKKADKEAEEQKGSEVIKFFNDPGFKIFATPKKLKIRNIFKTRMLYDTNVFAVDEDQEDDDFVWINSLDTEILYQYSKELTLIAFGGLTTEYYFEEESLNDVFPSGGFTVDYKKDIFTFTLSGNASRSSQPNSQEFNGRDPSHDFSASFLFGINYKLWLFEVLNLWDYTDQRNITGDVQTYGQNFVLGYEALKKIFFVAEYRWKKIDNKEGFDLQIEQNRASAIDDTTGHEVLFGARFELSRKIRGQLLVGVINRSEKVDFAMDSSLTWEVNKYILLSLALVRGTSSSFSEDFIITSSGSFGFQWLITPDLAFKNDFTLSHIDGDDTETSNNYSTDTSLTYRFIKGIEGELFYQLEINTSDDDNAERERHIAGASLNIIF